MFLQDWLSWVMARSRRGQGGLIEIKAPSRGIQEYSGVFWSLQEYSRVFRIFQGGSGVFRRIEEY